MKKYVCLSCVRKAMLCLAAVVLCCSAQMLFAGNNPTSETDQKPETETLAADNIQPGDYTIVGSCSSTGGSFEVSPRDYDATNYRWSVDNGWTPYVNDQYFCQFEGIGIVNQRVPLVVELDLRGCHHPGPYQIPGGLRRQMGDPLLPSCGFHPGLHHGVYDLRLHDRRVQGSQY